MLLQQPAFNEPIWADFSAHIHFSIVEPMVVPTAPMWMCAIPVVLSNSHPLKVLGSVVKFILVLVIDARLVLRIWNESQRNQTMNQS